MANSEHSIKTKDLIFVLLCAWRQMIVFAVIGVFLLAGFAFYRGRIFERSSIEVVLTSEETDVVEATVLKENSDVLLLREKIEKLNERVNISKHKLADSIYLKIDEKAQPLASFNIVITPEMPSEESEDTYEHRKYFLNLELLKIAKDEEFANYLVAAYQDYVEVQWIAELISLSLDEDNHLYFEVTALDLENAERLATEAETFFDENIRESVDVDYLYDIEIQNRKSLVVANPLIKMERERVGSEIDGLLLKIDEAKEEIDLIIEEVLEEALEEKIEQIGAQPKPSLKRNMLKYGIAGAFIGILIAAFIAVFRATSSALIWSPEEFADQLKLLYIGSIAVASPQVKKKFGSGIDRWLEGLFYRKRGVDAKESVRYAVSVIEGLAGKEGTELDVELPFTVAVMGEAEDSSIEMLVEAIKELPSIQSVRVVADTAEGIKVLRSADSVVQLVQARRTSMRKAIHDLELAAGMGVRIHGIVGVESVKN